MAESQYAEVLRRVADGKRVRMAGPTGKLIWYEPTWEDRKWACELIARELIINAPDTRNMDGDQKNMDKPKNEPLTETVEEFANALGVAESTVYAQIAKGTIEAIRIGRSVRIPRRVREKLLAPKG